MANSGGIITHPVSPIADVAAVLGVRSGDIATLCLSSAINMWSKVKPVYSSSVGCQPSEVAELMKSADFGICAGNTPYGIFGVGKYQFVTTSWMANGKWGYKRPANRFRLLDFDGYNHNAQKVPPASVDFVYTNTQQDPDLLQVLFTVNEYTPIQMRDFGEIENYGPVDLGGYRYVVVIDKLGGTGSSEVDFDVILGSPFFLTSSLDYYHRPTPGPNEVISIDMSQYPANTRVAAGIMRITAQGSGYSYGRWCIMQGGYYNYTRSSITTSVSLSLRWRGIGDGTYGIDELRFSVATLAGYSLANLDIVVDLYHGADDTQPYYTAGASLADPYTGAYLAVDVSGSPVVVSGSDYMTVMYTYRENGVLKTYYFDFRYTLTSETPYPKQQIITI